MSLVSRWSCQHSSNTEPRKGLHCIDRCSGGGWLLTHLFLEGLGKILDEWTAFYRNGMLLQEHKNAGGGLDPYHHLVVMNSPCVRRQPAGSPVTRPRVSVWRLACRQKAVSEPCRLRTNAASHDYSSSPRSRRWLFGLLSVQ